MHADGLTAGSCMHVHGLSDVTITHPHGAFIVIRLDDEWTTESQHVVFKHSTASTATVCRFVTMASARESRLT